MALPSFYLDTIMLLGLIRAYVYNLHGLIKNILMLVRTFLGIINVLKDMMNPIWIQSIPCHHARDAMS